MSIKQIKPKKSIDLDQKINRFFLFSRKGARDTRQKEFSRVAFIYDDTISISTGAYPSSISTTVNTIYFNCPNDSNFKINFRIKKRCNVFIIATFKNENATAALELDGLTLNPIYTTPLNTGNSIINIENINAGLHNVELVFGENIESPRLSLYAQHLVNI